MLNPLLDDLRDEVTTALIESGNLARKNAPPVFIPKWRTLGYTARITRNFCNCGDYQETLTGIFLRERAETGETRETSIPPNRLPLPSEGNHPIIVTETHSTICPSCITLHQFSEDHNV